MWHASSRGVASNNLELENAEGIPQEAEGIQTRLQNARKKPMLFCVIVDSFWRSHHWHSTQSFKIDRRNRECRRKTGNLKTC
jgi:hypothetical protein